VVGEIAYAGVKMSVEAVASKMVVSDPLRDFRRKTSTPLQTASVFIIKRFNESKPG
jgi:hypothetical protein